jgi:hypothetical protein
MWRKALKYALKLTHEHVMDPDRLNAIFQPNTVESCAEVLRKKFVGLFNTVDAY